MSDNYVLHADSISKSFRRRRVLSSASLRASPGKIIGLLGRMGEGKSTLMKICAGLDSPDGGWVKYGGQLRTSISDYLLSHEGLYYMPELGGLAESLTLGDHFELFRRRFDLGAPEDVIDQFSVRPFLAASPSSMSTGERRRSEIALLSYRRPACLLADEIFRGLDPIAAESIGQSLQSLAHVGCAIVVTGHEVPALKPYLTSVVWLTAGTTYELGHPANAWNDARFRREYLGPLG